MNKEFNSIPSDETTDNSITNAEETNVSQPFSNTPVGCSSLSTGSLLDKLGVIDTTPNYLKERYGAKRPFPFAPWM